MFVDQQYFRGFTLTEKPVTATEVLTTKIDSYILTYSKDLQVHEYRGKQHLILIGYAVLAEDIHLSAEEILEKIDGCEGDAKYQLLNRLNGRYFIIIADEDVRIYPDATTMRPVFYHEEYSVVASNSALAAEVIKQLYDAQVDEYNGEMNGYLDYSRYRGIYKLNPNTYLTVGVQKTVRFFPDRPFEDLSQTEVLNQSIEYFTRIREWLKKQDAYITVTAGIDSRVSLAVMHDKSVPLLTYNSLGKLSTFAKMAYENDVKTVRKMVQDLGFNHILIDIDSNNHVSQETKTYSKQFDSTHSFSLSEKLIESELKGKLHIKSNIFELAKLPVVAKYYESKDFSFMTHIIKKKPKALQSAKDDVIINEYLRRADLSPDKAMGHYLPDLYYQEQRMGNWHSNITQETDNTVDIFILLNTREMLRLVTSAPVHVRQKRMLHREWINHFWPVLNFYPINDEANLYELFKGQSEELIIEGDRIMLQEDEWLPKWPLKNTEIPFTIHNRGQKTRTIELKSYYSNQNALGTIKLRMGSKTYHYQDIVAGYPVSIEAGETIACAIIYNKLYDRISWQKAARLTIK